MKVMSKLSKNNLLIIVLKTPRHIAKWVGIH